MATNSLLERFVAQINANVFFAEFAFPSARLRVPGTGEYELADHLVLLDEIGLIFQLKERDLSAPRSAADLSAWFDAKIRKKAVKQIGDTQRLLGEHAGAEIPNDRGEIVRLPAAPPTKLASLVIYAAPPTSQFRPPKYYVSRSAGFVHFVHAADYFGLCDSLVTPTEVLDYLLFRERAVKSLMFAPAPVSETALVGQFMGGDLGAIPNERYAAVHHALVDERDDWDISFLTSRLGEQMTFREGDAPESAHHRILAELAKLARSELKELKQRLRLTLEAVQRDEFRDPYRFAIPRNDCAFLIFPVPSKLRDRAQAAAHNYVVASKHELRVSKQIGIAVMRAGEHIDIIWMLHSGPCGPNPEVDALLEANYPFRPVHEALMPRYHFDSDGLRDAIG